MPQLDGRTCMITGASNGIGREAARSLARMGAELVLVCRNAERAQATVDEIRRETPQAKLDTMLADLSSQAEIRKLASDFLATGRPLHILLNNAGAFFQKRAETVDGIERTFALNHLNYFLLTNLLLERLRASTPARVVSVASGAHTSAKGGIPFDDIENRKSFNPLTAYGQSKLANILFTRELARRLDGAGVTANCLHPGFVATGFGRNNSRFMSAVMTLLSPFARNPKKGAETSIYLCSAPELEGVSGEYFADCKIAQPNAYGRDDAAARKLWELSAERVGLPFQAVNESRE